MPDARQAASARLHCVAMLPTPSPTSEKDALAAPCHGTMNQPGEPRDNPPAPLSHTVKLLSFRMFLLEAIGIVMLFAFYCIWVPYAHQEYIGEWFPWRHRPPSLGGTYPRILLWTPAEDNDWPPTEQRMLMECMTKPGREPCYITRYDSFLTTSDAIVFDASRIDPYKLPRRRHPDQAWVFSTLEGAPQPPSLAFRAISHLFNWTMSVRQDADVVVTYKTFNAYNEDRYLPTGYLAQATLEKPKTAAPFVNGCEEPLRNNTEGRDVRYRPHSTENYFKHVNRTFDVYMFSDCGRPLCNSRMECLEMVARDFYFLFVLESSPCFDHPLELIYDSFEWDIVPVYFGQSSLGNVIPPGSVYDTTSEDTAFAIVDKLNILRNNITEYLPYLTWKEVYYPAETEDPLCTLCDALHRTPEAHCSQRTNVMVWWEQRRDCGYVYPSPGLPMTVVRSSQDGAHIAPDGIADIPGRIRRAPLTPRSPEAMESIYEDGSAKEATERGPREML